MGRESKWRQGVKKVFALPQGGKGLKDGMGDGVAFEHVAALGGAFPLLDAFFSQGSKAAGNLLGHGDRKAVVPEVCARLLYHDVFSNSRRFPDNPPFCRFI